MGKALIIAEKPSVARDIANALGGGFREESRNVAVRDDLIVTSALGHLVEIGLPEGEDKGWALEHLPVIPSHYQLNPIEKTKALVSGIRALVRRSDVDVVVNACDAGREGELIFGYVMQFINCRKPVKRMWLQSMTADAIRQAYRHMLPGEAKATLLDAAMCRSESDLLIGFNGTRALTSLYRSMTGEDSMASAGRVQTPVLALIVDRENAIKGFQPRDFWEVHGDFRAAKGAYLGKWHKPKEALRQNDPDDRTDRLWSLDEARSVVQRCAGAAVTAVEEDSKPSSKAAPRLFDLTSLQREANKKLGLTAKETLKIAQSLYESHKVLTYPRTDSSHLPEDYIETANKLMGGFAAASPHAQRIVEHGWVKADKRIFDNSKISDHFAIIPTGQKSDQLSEMERRVYDMVLSRFFAAFHPAAEYLLTTRWTSIGADRFRSSGKVLVKAGWLEVYGMGAIDEDDEKLPALAPVDIKGGELPANEAVREHKGVTKPPSRYTEATLLDAMESAGRLVDDDELRTAMAERGLGTPATRADIIEALLSPRRQYIERHKKELIPTGKGIQIVHVLRAVGVEALTSPAMTGEWEYKLRLMEQGKFLRGDFMREIEQMTQKIVEQIRQKSAATPQRAAELLEAPCPMCGGKLHVGSRTVDCASGCGFKLWRNMSGRAFKTAELEQLVGERVLPTMSGFVSAKTKRAFSAGLKLTDEGKVEFVFADRAASGEQKNRPPAADSGKTCPQCGTGRMLVRTSARGQFLGCSNFPRCKHTEQMP